MSNKIKAGGPDEQTNENNGPVPIKKEASVVPPADIKDPEWAKHSVVDPKTGIHISQWRQEELRRREKR